jgi:hypothetical protein
MSKHEEHPEVRAVEDAAWNVKDCAADLYGRVLSGPDKAALASVLRDLQRLHERLIGVRDKRKRGNGAVAEPVAEEPAP